VSGGFPADNVRKFETQIINSVRKGTIAGIAARQRVLAAEKRRSLQEAETIPPLATTTTPQGFVAQVQGLDWKSVLLAHAPDGSKLEFLDLGPELREALQSNQLFLVVSLAKPLGR